MAGFKIDVGIKKSIRVVKDADVFARREKILRYTAGRIQGEAQRRSAIPPGDIAKGRVSGNLQASIQIKEPEKSPSGRSVSLTVWANPAAAKSKSGKPYARFEELGTGEYSEAPESPKQPIRPHGGKPFMWIQTGKPYRRWPYVKALARVRKPVPTPFHGKRPWRKLKGGGIARSYNKMTTTEWLQVATEIHGIKPKHFMRDAATKQILADHTRLIREAALHDIVEVTG